MFKKPSPKGIHTHFDVIFAISMQSVSSSGDPCIALSSSARGKFLMGH
jgi:hypothetical protein